MRKSIEKHKHNFSKVISNMSQQQFDDMIENKLRKANGFWAWCKWKGYNDLCDDKKVQQYLYEYARVDVE